MTVADVKFHCVHCLQVLETTKLLIRSHQRTKLDLTNESESNLLLELWSSSECQKAITEFLNDESNYTF